MSRAEPEPKETLARETWRLLFDFFVATRSRRDEVLTKLKLTPNHARALATLDAREGIPMAALADAWGTDASNATWIIDRMEREGLAERRGVPHDRRVKLVVLTAKGVRMRARLRKAIYEPPAEMIGLGEKELAALRDALRALTPKKP